MAHLGKVLKRKAEKNPRENKKSQVLVRTGLTHWWGCLGRAKLVPLSRGQSCLLSPLPRPALPTTLGGLQSGWLPITAGRAGPHEVQFPHSTPESASEHPSSPSCRALFRSTLPHCGPKSPPRAPDGSRDPSNDQGVFIAPDTCLLSHFSHVRLFVTPWTVARQAPLSMGFSRQEYWSGLPCPPSRGSSPPRDQTHVSYISCTGNRAH